MSVENAKAVHGMMWQQSGAFYQLDIECKNVGKTPATNVSIDAELFTIWDKGIDETIAEYSQGSKIGRFHVGKIVFPDRPYTCRVKIVLSRPRLDEAAERVNFEDWTNTSPLHVILVGSIQYGLTVDKERHVT